MSKSTMPLTWNHYDLRLKKKGKIVASTIGGGKIYSIDETKMFTRIFFDVLEDTILSKSTKGTKVVLMYNKIKPAWTQRYDRD